MSYDDYNLACIVVLPPYQKKGYGMLLIEFSQLFRTCSSAPLGCRRHRFHVSVLISRIRLRALPACGQGWHARAPALRPRATELPHVLDLDARALLPVRLAAPLGYIYAR